MKKIVLLLICLLITFSAQAGTFAVDSGTVFFSGELYYEKGIGDAYDSRSLLIAPGFHYFLFRKFSVGFDLHLESFRQNGTEYNQTSALIMVQYFMGKKSGLIFPYIGFGFGGGALSFSSISQDYKSLKIATGINFLFNDYIGLKTVASYTYDDVKSSGVTRSGGRLRIGAGIVIFLF